MSVFDAENVTPLQLLTSLHLRPPRPFAIPPSVTSVPGLTRSQLLRAHAHYRHQQSAATATSSPPHSFILAANSNLKRQRKLEPTRAAANIQQNELVTAVSPEGGPRRVHYVKEDTTVLLELFQPLLDALAAEPLDAAWLATFRLRWEAYELVSGERKIMDVEADLGSFIRELEMALVGEILKCPGFFKPGMVPDLGNLGWYLAGSGEKGATDYIFAHNPDVHGSSASSHNPLATVAMELKRPHLSQLPALADLDEFVISAASKKERPVVCAGRTVHQQVVDDLLQVSKGL